VIALWLGHEQVETTHIYLHADMGIKERALASHFWRHCDYADSIAAIATARARSEPMVGIIQRLA
jgi:hypothetical protein